MTTNAFNPKNKQNTTPKSRTYKALSLIYNLFYYTFGLLFIVVVAFSVQSGNRYASLLGYSTFYVETRSMDSVMPRGSLIIVKEIDKNELDIGDDITFFEPITDSQLTAGRIITHRIIEIDTQVSTRERSFKTKGVDNPAPDKEKVSANNVIGKVIFIIPGLGVYLTYIKERAVTVVILGVLILLFIRLAMQYFKQTKAEKKE